MTPSILKDCFVTFVSVFTTCSIARVVYRDYKDNQKFKSNMKNL